ncbi:MAG: Rpn family recombination-promoting nuclease/putative transposase [Myxococcota bacterium]
MADPHDKLFKAVFTETRYAIAHFRKFLAPQVVGLLDLDAAERQDATFIDHALREREADVLYAVPWSRPDEPAEPDKPPALLYLLFEHQSTVDSMMPRRLLRYMDRIWDSWLAANKGAARLPAILPLVLYHGAREWTAATGFGELLDLPEAARPLVEPYVPMFQMILQDIPRMPDALLAGSTFDAAARMLFKHGRSPNVIEVFGASPELIEALSTSDLRQQRQFIEYVSDTNEHVERDALVEFVARNIGQEAAEMGLTLSDRLREEGRVEGIRLVLVNQIALKYGARGEQVERRVMEASEAQVLAWIGKILDAPTLAELLGEESR